MTQKGQKKVVDRSGIEPERLSFADYARNHTPAH